MTAATTRNRPPRHGGGPTGRMLAMVLRHLYVLRRSWPRLLELAYWPIVQMILWGLITKFFLTHSDWLVQAAGALLAAVLLWDVLFRSQIGVTIAFLEEMWSRNLAHIMVSPLRPIEFTISLGLMSMMRTLIGFVPATLLAIPLYHYSIYDMGLPLVAFFLCLVVFGWGMGFAIAALLMRWGLAAESLAWLAIFALAPLSGVYYPIDTLPSWVQPVSWALPSAHIFEGMRAFLFEGVFRIDYLLRAIALDLVYLCLGASAFLYSIRLARIHGLFLRVGE